MLAAQIDDFCFLNEIRKHQQKMGMLNLQKKIVIKHKKAIRAQNEHLAKNALIEWGVHTNFEPYTGR